MKTLININPTEIKTTIFELFDEETAQKLIENNSEEELLDIIKREEESIYIEDKDIPKHSPSRKKKANRVKKESTQYKKKKEKKWEEKRRTKIGDKDVNNRAYLNKASKAYNKLHPQTKQKK